MIIDYILNKLKPIIIFIGIIHMPWSRKKVTGWHYFLMRDKINVGTVLLTTTNGELSNLINPEDIKHAGVYIGDLYNSGVKYVLEATGKGVVKTDLVSFLTTKDLVIGCEANFLADADKKEIQINAEKFLGIPYDYSFSLSKEKFYCFELAATLINSVKPEINLQKKKVIKNKLIYSYETFLDTRLFNISFDTREIKG